MQKFTVNIKEEINYEVVVEAIDFSDAEHKARIYINNENPKVKCVSNEECITISRKMEL